MAISAVLPLKASGSYDVNDLKRAHILFTYCLLSCPGMKWNWSDMNMPVGKG